MVKSLTSKIMLSVSDRQVVANFRSTSPRLVITAVYGLEMVPGMPGLYDEIYGVYALVSQCRYCSCTERIADMRFAVSEGESISFFDTTIGTNAIADARRGHMLCGGTKNFSRDMLAWLG